MMAAVKERAPGVGVAPLCSALGLPRATLYRTWRRERFPVAPKPRPKPARALGQQFGLPSLTTSLRQFLANN